VETALDDRRLPEMDLWAVFPAAVSRAQKPAHSLRSSRLGCAADHALTTTPDYGRSRLPQLWGTLVLELGSGKHVLRVNDEQEIVMRLKMESL
jgi:hypothetical protein